MRSRITLNSRGAQVDGADLAPDWLRALMTATGWPALLAQLETSKNLGERDVI
jgi:hypothetical protein